MMFYTTVRFLLVVILLGCKAIEAVSSSSSSGSTTTSFSSVSISRSPNTPIDYEGGEMPGAIAHVYPANNTIAEPHILNLPDEHLKHIFSYLTDQNFSKIQLKDVIFTCKTFCNIVCGINHNIRIPTTILCNPENIESALDLPMSNLTIFVEKQEGLDAIAPVLTKARSLHLTHNPNIGPMNVVGETWFKYFGEFADESSLINISSLAPSEKLEKLTVQGASVDINFYELAEKFPNLRYIGIQIYGLQELKKCCFPVGISHKLFRLSKLISLELISPISKTVNMERLLAPSNEWIVIVIKGDTSSFAFLKDTEIDSLSNITTIRFDRGNKVFTSAI